MTVKLKKGEVFSAEMVFHVDYNELNKIIKDEIDKAMVKIDKRITDYALSHITARKLD